MSEDILAKDFTAHLNNLQALKVFLEKLYYDAEFSTFFSRPLISMLMVAVDYLEVNLVAQRNRWRVKV
jgi:hypothetical protein